MKSRVIMYTNRNTEKAMWMTEKKAFVSTDTEQYQMMAYTQFLLREQKDPEFREDITEGVRLMLNVNGYDIT